MAGSGRWSPHSVLPQQVVGASHLRAPVLAAEQAQLWSPVWGLGPPFPVTYVPSPVPASQTAILTPQLRAQPGLLT